MIEPGFTPVEIDTSRPHPARLYDYYLGGKDNYAADREAGDQVLAVVPEVRDMARQNRAFLQRAVRFLVGEAGIRQILDIGTGIPTAGNVHEIAGPIAPDTRVVYVDNDTIVHVHSNALLTGSGTTSVVLGDVREPAAILAHPKVQRMIDFDQPMALMLAAILHFITDEEDPAGIVSTLRDALPDGSYLVISHGSSDFHKPETIDKAASAYQRATAPLVLRSHAEIATFFDGFDLIEPGLVQLPLWRPDGSHPVAEQDLSKIAMYGGVGQRRA
ncbi:MAG TPA: SAM-dependent methyltransferase [Streptosporangiaceae bacterium]|jgi:hypothetical protein